MYPIKQEVSEVEPTYVHLRAEQLYKINFFAQSIFTAALSPTRFQARFNIESYLLLFRQGLLFSINMSPRS